MKRVVFVDLDDTLFQTTRKNPKATKLAAVDKDGRPLSFQCRKQSAFLEWLAQDARVVPVTGRSVDAFKRVLLPLGDFAICSFGGVILLPNGEPHPEWHGEISSAAATAALDALHRRIASIAGELGIDVRHRVIHDMGLSLYLSVKHNGHDTDEMARLATSASGAIPEGWTLHLNGTNMAVLPPFLGKERAVAFFLERIVGDKDVLTVGVGDSLTDMGYMRLCDFAVAPSKSQLFSLLSCSSRLVTTGGDSA
ncbi:hypothetical protein [Azospirillum ramasamyi]|uniref:Sucrose phosphatase-like domain-containing protein n=1 Tax=Azospirillum ramasamyi TaxID=682998 RepID=A0A2U9SC46_9PROT|nr:hypothetical protein [Azospirillum ramasamyi]AWU95269.1 hypothetical protein DM194_12975 [Azospirillum ramasamyi]